MFDLQTAQRTAEEAARATLMYYKDVREVYNIIAGDFL